MSSDTTDAPTGDVLAAPSSDGSSRRTFLKRLNLLIGGAIGVAAGVPFVRYLFFPVDHDVVTGGSGAAVPVIGADQVPAAGKPPVRVEIVVPEQRDAWARQSNVRLGAAWVMRDGDGKVKALSTTCPHLGCSINFDDSSSTFRCPCHKSAFSLDGSRIEGPAKRGMDPLETHEKDGRVYVTFARFKLDTPAREKA